MLLLIKTIFPYLKPYLKSGVFALLLALPLAGVKAYQVFLIKPLIDSGLSPNSTHEEALQLALMIVGLAVINYPLRYLHNFILRMIVDKATCAIRSHLFQKLQKVDSRSFSQEKSGNLLSIVSNDTLIFSESFYHSFSLIREPLNAIALLGVAFYMDWQLAFVVFGAVPFFYFILKITGEKLRKYILSAQQNVGEMTHTISEGIGGQKIIKAFNLQDYMFSRFTQVQEVFLGFRKKSNSVEEHSHPLVEIVGAIAFGGIIVFAHNRITQGTLTTGGFVSFIGAVAMFMEPVRKFSKANVKLNQARAALNRMMGLFNLNEEPQVVGQMKSFTDRIDFKNVSFAYEKDKVLTNLNLSIQKGEKLALVGLSGSGKSTIISLLLRLFDHYEGSIILDGKEVRDLPLMSYRDLFALVSQDIFLFNDSVKENLIAGGEFSEAKIAKALEVSYSSEFVDKLADGLDTVIGDRGLKLSGGQAQRLTIARAFLRDSEIILFDEATSALDNESEKIVQKAMDEIAKDKTVIAVAHRLSTIQDYDRIVVMKEGVVAEQGTHQELMELGGEYAKLYQLSTKS